MSRIIITLCLLANISVYGQTNKIESVTVSDSNNRKIEVVNGDTITTEQLDVNKFKVSTKKAGSNEIFTFVKQMPEPGYNINQYLAITMKYPKEAQIQKIQGRVFVKFVVDADGVITETEITKSAHPILDEEALRVVKSMPPWIPGRQNDKPVRVYYTLPINFRL